VRRSDGLVARYGGEEFVLILPDATAADARRRADQLRGMIKGLQLSHRGQPLGPLQCSIGVSAYPDHGSTGEELLRAADAALYRAKREGRDQVVVAG